MVRSGFLLRYMGSDEEPIFLFHDTPAECAEVLGLELCEAAGCHEHIAAMGPHVHTRESQFGPPYRYLGDRPADVLKAGQELREYVVRSCDDLTIRWHLYRAVDDPPVVYLQPGKIYYSPRLHRGA